jgi:GT2 family glycosyltransferase
MGELIETLRLGVLAKLFPRARLPLWPQPEPFQGDWLSGCSLLIRREVFEDIGLMDEDYFLYFEESDFCLQAQRKGWELWYTPGGRIYHEAGSSTGIWAQDEKAPRRPAYWFESRRRYFLKNFNPAYAAAADVMHMLGFSLWRLRRMIQHKPDLDPPYYLKDFFRNSVFVKGFALKK